MAHSEFCLTLNTSIGVYVPVAINWSCALQEKQKHKTLDRQWALLTICQSPWLGHSSLIHSFGPAPDLVANPMSS